MDTVDAIFLACCQRFVYEQWRGSSRTIVNKYLPLENPQDFPSRRGQAIAYTYCVCPAWASFIYCKVDN